MIISIPFGDDEVLCCIWSITVTVKSQCESFSFVCLNTYSLLVYSDCDLARSSCHWSTADISQ